MEISRDGGRSRTHTSPRYRLFAREGLIPYFRRGAHTRTNAHTDTSRYGRCIFARRVAVFYYIGKQNVVKKISYERIFCRSEDVRNRKRFASEEFGKLKV